LAQQTSNEGLVRGIRRWDLVAVTINGIIGAGIFGLPSKVYALIGSYSLIAFVVCAPGRDADSFFVLRGRQSLRANRRSLSLRANSIRFGRCI
jgi:hypothetical protein